MNHLPLLDLISVWPFLRAQRGGRDYVLRVRVCPVSALKSEEPSLPDRSVVHWEE